MAQPRNNRRPTPILVTGIVVIGSNAFVLSPILTDVAQSLGTTPVVVARVISAYGGATALSAFFLAGSIDRLGAKRILLVAAATMAMALLASAASANWRVLALAQAVAGLAAGLMLPAIYATATASAPSGQGARTLGQVLNGWAISLVLGVPASAFVTQYFGWRLAYLLLAALAAVALFGFLRLRLPAPATNTPSISPLKAATLPGVPTLLVICLAYMSAFYGTYAFLGDHLRTAVGLSTGQAGLVVLAYGAGFGFASFGGAWLDRLGAARVLPFMLVVLSAIYLAMLPASTAYGTSILIAVVWGVANHFGLNMIVLLLSRQHPPARGAILGLHSTMTYTAVFAGPLLLGALYARLGFQAVAAVASVLVLCGAIPAGLNARRCRSE